MNQANNLSQFQKDALLRMLNLNQDIADAPIQWKVLIYDKYGQDIISPILRLGELRSCGITLHMAIKSDRQPIPDVPAIYFVQPTQENIRIIGQDLQKRLYDTIHINFTSTLSRSLLEDLAALAVQSNMTSSIAQIYDQFLNYVCLDKNLFSLEMPKTYHLLHNPTTPDQLIEKTVDDIAIALFSVVVTTGNVPVIKCQKGNVAEAVAKKLDAKLRDNIMNSRASLFADKLHLSRPGIYEIDSVLVLLDRNLDLTTMFAHSWAYSCLFHDLLDMKLNRIHTTVDERGKTVKKTYDIDVTDTFWAKNSSLPLPEVGMFIDNETKQYKELVNSVGNSAIEDDPNSITYSTQQLSQTMQKLPELRQRQKVLDMHTVLATLLLNSIVARQLDSFISMEESIGKLNPAAILEVIKDQSKNSEDKLRLFLLYYLSVGDIQKSDMNSIETALGLAGCDTSCLQYIKQYFTLISVKMYSTANIQMQQQQFQAPGSPSTSDLLGSFSSNFSKLTGFQSAGIGEKFGNIIAGVKNLLPARKELPVTLAVDAIMDGQGPGSIVEDYLTFDPKNPRGQQAIKNQSFADAIVFVIGGGNYKEYMNVMEHCQRSTLEQRSVIYGSTELLSAKEFISQLSGLSLD